MPDHGLTSVVGCPPIAGFNPRGWTRCHCCAGALAHGCSSTTVPWAAVGIVRHWLLIRKLSSWAYVHVWALEPVHALISAGVPFASPLPAAVRHSPPRSIWTSPAAPTLGAGLTVQVNETEPDCPAAFEALTVAVYVPVATGQPVICPAALMLVPGGRPAAEYDTSRTARLSARLNWRSTAAPATLVCGPGSSSGITAGLIWSRSVFPAASIPRTVPSLEYCQNA